MSKLFAYIAWAACVIVLIFCQSVPSHSNEDLQQFDNSIAIESIENHSNSGVFVTGAALTALIIQIFLYRKSKSRIAKVISIAIIIWAFLIIAQRLLPSSRDQHEHAKSLGTIQHCNAFNNRGVA